MRRIAFCLAAVLATVAAMPAFAASSFQDTCSNITFAYSGTAPTLEATCLRVNGTPNHTSLILKSISNNNGTLTQGSGNSTFQQSCGNIRILVDIRNATLSAFCRTVAGAFNRTTLPLDNISNNNGTLTQ